MTIDSLKNLSIGKIRGDALFILLFAFCLPLKNSLFNTVAVLYALYFLWHTISNRSIPHPINKTSLRRTKYLPLLLLAMFFSIAYSENKPEGWHVVIKSVTLLAVPVFFALIRLKEIEKETILITFIWGNFIAFIVNIGRATWRSIHIVDDHLIFDPTVLGGQEFWYSIVQGGNYYFIEEFSTFSHPSYWSFYLLFSSIIIIAFFRKRKFITNREKVKYSTLLFVNLIAIFMCSSRIIMIGTIVVTIIYFTVLFIQKKSFFLLATGILTAVVLMILIINSPRVGGFSNLSNHLKYDLRINTWRAGIQVLKRSPVFGSGVGDTEKLIMEEYKTRGYEDNFRLELNEHNQYLQIANQTGVVGFAFFLLGIGSAFFISIRNKDFIQLAFIICFSLVCLVECFLARQAGITFYTFFYCLLFIPHDKETATTLPESV